MIRIIVCASLIILNLSFYTKTSYSQNAVVGQRVPEIHVRRVFLSVDSCSAELDFAVSLHDCVRRKVQH